MKSTSSKAKWPKLNGVIDAQRKLNSGTWGHEVLNLRARKNQNLFQGDTNPNGRSYAVLYPADRVSCRKYLMKKGNPCIREKDLTFSQSAESCDTAFEDPSLEALDH